MSVGGCERGHWDAVSGRELVAAGHLQLCDSSSSAAGYLLRLAARHCWAVALGRRGGARVANATVLNLPVLHAALASICSF
ncbi:hypothetical protein Patl1_28906 [Pistacia atlantica]|uniref:Uncharacterized protein n=1 Tax=Pistacia atlantica TaxID=434234 RepID=A0ACC1BBI7_9ROSI|nr:hypothetical protein Patl1_28906 [Pistacia atlantica]